MDPIVINYSHYIIFKGDNFLKKESKRIQYVEFSEKNSFFKRTFVIEYF